MQSICGQAALIKRIQASGCVCGCECLDVDVDVDGCSSLAHISESPFSNTVPRRRVHFSKMEATNPHKLHSQREWKMGKRPKGVVE